MRAPAELRPQTVALWLRNAHLRRALDTIVAGPAGTVEVRLGVEFPRAEQIPDAHRARVYLVLMLVGGHRRCRIAHARHDTEQSAGIVRWWDVLVVEQHDVIAPGVVLAVARALAVDDGVPTLLLPQLNDETWARYVRLAWAALAAERALLRQSMSTALRAS